MVPAAQSPRHTQRWTTRGAARVLQLPVPKYPYIVRRRITQARPRFNIYRYLDYETARRAYRTIAKRAHPDTGGSHDYMTSVNLAWEYLSKKLRKKELLGD